MTTWLNTILLLWLTCASNSTKTTTKHVCHDQLPLDLLKTCPVKNIPGSTEKQKQKLSLSTILGDVLDSKLGKRTQQFVDEMEGMLEKRLTKKNATKKENMRKLLVDLERKQEEIKHQIEKIAAYIEQKETKRTENLPRNCQEVLKIGNTVSGIYTVRPKYASQGFEVRCDMDSSGGGWTYVLNRFDGSQDFFLKWDSYKKGFGRLAGEFWCGLELLYQMTNSRDNELLIELVDWNNEKVYAKYDNFKLGNESQGYRLEILGDYSGNAGDSLRYHVNAKFGTKDQTGTHCPNAHHGAWWYKNCWQSHLTGTYGKGMIWETYHGRNYSLRKVRMMIRPLDREI